MVCLRNICINTLHKGDDDDDDDDDDDNNNNNNHFIILINKKMSLNALKLTCVTAAEWRKPMWQSHALIPVHWNQL